MTIHNRNINIIGIYHPPYSATNMITDNQFIDEFTEFIGDILRDYTNVIVCGDFNIHFGDMENQIAQRF